MTKAIAEGLIPPTWHLTDPDPELTLDFRAIAVSACTRAIERRETVLFLEVARDA